MEGTRRVRLTMIYDFMSMVSCLLSKNIIRIYRTIILPVVLYGCETWSLTLREEHRLRVFEQGWLQSIRRSVRNYCGPPPFVYIVYWYICLTLNWVKVFFSIRRL
jgi:hypothetical protein